MSKPTSVGSSSKLEEQAKAKGDFSYSYWASTDKPANNPELAPKKLSEEEVAKLQQAGEQQGRNASAWNAAGTFEERAVTDWAKQQLQQTLVGTRSSKAVITSCNVLSGDAHIWFIRGKKRHGFEFDIELQWKLSSSSSPGDDSAAAQAAGTADAEAGSSGSIKLSAVSPDELDDLSHMEVTVSNAVGDAAAESVALAAAKGLKEPLEHVLDAFYAELRAK
ncbi:activator of Hsp90 ATPase [Scenedesmus sp. NREL 46B-D3]|nr:activator of Hsp90 ATPase [Scenedesmus sp. NREL 46B-D3]